MYIVKGNKNLSTWNMFPQSKVGCRFISIPSEKTTEAWNACYERMQENAKEYLMIFKNKEEIYFFRIKQMQYCMRLTYITESIILSKH